MTELRTERTVGVTSKVTAAAARNLWVLANSETWGDLLDVMERGCIEIETRLINTAVADSAAVLENHKLSQAGWVIFEFFQTRILEASNFYLSGVAPQSVAPQFTEEEEEREYTLNPTNYPSATFADADGSER